MYYRGANMVEKSKITTLEGNLKDSYIVQKTEPLLLMRTVPFNLGELKILDTYLSRINSRDPSCTTVTFTKKEYEKLMDLNDVDLRTLRKYTKSMLGKVVDLPIDGGYVQFTLFTSAVCKQDEYGQQIIELSCSPQAKQVFFNENIRYLQYELKYILPLTSKYSYLLYLYLRDNRFRGTWRISVDELRDKKLDLKGNEYYKQFKYLKNEIINPAIKEIKEKTDIDVSFKTIKKGKPVVAIEFTYHSKVIDIEATTKEDEQLALDFESYSKKYPDMFHELNAIYQLGLTHDQVEVIKYEAQKYAPISINNDTEISEYNYILEKIKLMNVQTNPVKNKFSWLKKAIIEDFK